MKIKPIVLLIIKLINRLIAFFAIFVASTLLFLAIHPIKITKLDSYLKDKLHSSEITYQAKGLFLGVHHLRLVICLPDIKIFKNDKTIFQAKEIKIGVDFVNSLIEKTFIPNFVLVQGSNLSWSSDQPNNFKTPSTGFDYKKLPLFFANGQIIISSVNINYQSPDGKLWILKNLEGKLKNNLGTHDLAIKGEFAEGKNRGLIEGNLRFNGDFTSEDHPLDDCSGHIILKSGSYDLSKLSFAHSGKNKEENSTFLPWLGKKGTVKLICNNFQVKTASFAKPIYLDDFKTLLDWSLTKKQINFYKLEFKDRLLTMYGGGKLDFSKNIEADINLIFSVKRLEKIGRYYPRKIMDADLLAWLDTAFKKGEISSGSLHLRGDLSKFPFDHEEDSFFKASLTVDKTDLLYQKNWPIISDMKAHLFFKNRSLAISLVSGKILGEPIKKITAKIDNLESSLLNIEGKIDTDSKVGLNFIHRSPLEKTIGSKIKELSIRGPLNLNLHLAIPLSEKLADQATKIEGALYFKDNILSSPNIPLEFNKITGNLNFTENSMNSQSLTGRISNYPANLVVTTLTNGNIRLDIRSLIELPTLEKIFEIQLPFLEGSFDYNLGIIIPEHGGETVFKLESNLENLICSLPPPFKKTNETSTPLHVILNPLAKNQLGLDFNWNNFLKAKLILSHKTKLSLVKGVVHCGNNLEDPEIRDNPEKLLVKINTKTLDLRIWEDFFDKSKTPTKNTKVTQFDFLPFDKIKIFLETEKLWFKNFLLHKVLCNLEKAKNGYQFTIASEELKGSILAPYLFQNTLKGDLLYWKDLISEASTSEKSSFQAENFPWQKFDLSISEFRQGKWKFSDLFLKGNKKGMGFDFQQLALRHEGVQVDTQGEWGNRNFWKVKGKAIIYDLGKSLEKITSHCYGGEGSVVFNIEKNQGKLKGHIKTKLEKGGIINLSHNLEEKLNLGKVVNALDVRSLTKNISLDFKDYKNGYWYNNIEGDIFLENKELIVSQLKSSSTPADMKLTGKVNWQTKTVDLILAITPKLTGSVPIVAGVAGGPVVGAIALVANQVVNKVVNAVFEYRYRLSGKIDNLVIHEIK